MMARKVNHIFLYDEDTPTVENYIHAYKHIKAISDDEKHYFEFTVNQDDYEQSLNELCNEFKNFCVNVCGFNDAMNCEVWSAFCAHSKIDHIHGYRDKIYFETLQRLLGACDWATVYYMETDYYYKCSHLRLQNNDYDRSPTFEEFAAAHGYKESDEPYAAKKLFEIYNSTVNKKEFNSDELNKIHDFVMNNLYLIEYKQIISFAANISDFFIEHLHIDFFDNYHTEIKCKTKRHILNNLHTLDGAIIRLYANDKKALKSIIKNFADLRYKRYIQTTIKNRKIYEE